MQGGRPTGQVGADTRALSRATPDIDDRFSRTPATIESLRGQNAHDREAQSLEFARADQEDVYVATHLCYCNRLDCPADISSLWRKRWQPVQHDESQHCRRPG